MTSLGLNAVRYGIPLALLTLVVWCLEGLTFMLIARAVGVTLDLLPALAVVVLASLLAAVPAAPGYVGTFDAGLLVGLAAAGVEGGDAVGVLLMARFMFFVPVTLVGLGTLVNQSSTTPGGVKYLAFVAPGVLAATAMQIGTQEASWPVLGWSCPVAGCRSPS